VFWWMLLGEVIVIVVKHLLDQNREPKQLK
jgi:hypothetical protein